MRLKSGAAFIALGLALGLPGGAAALESAWLVDGSFSGLYGQDPDDKTGATATGGSQLSFFIMPIFGSQGSRWLWSPSFDARVSSARQPLEVDDDLFLFSVQATSLLEMGGTFKPHDDSRWTLRGFYENFSGKLTADEEWGRGLYDYQDLGAYAEWNRKWDTRASTASTFGYRFTDRRYFNFTSLDGSGLREKDSAIHKVFVDYEIAWPTASLFMTKLEYAYQAFPFYELRVQDESGQLTQADGSPTPLRLDHVHSFSLSMPLEAGRHHWYLAYDGEVRASNLSYFDSQNFLFIDGFNDYSEHSLTLGYGYEIPRFWFFRAPYVGVQFSTLARRYASRPAQDKNGGYKEQKQEDGQAQFNLDLNSAITDHWSLFLNTSRVTYSSNNDNEGSSINSYRFFTTSLGLQFSY